MIGDRSAQDFGFRIRVDEMCADQESIQSSCNMSWSCSFVVPSIDTIFRFDVCETPMRDQIFQHLPKWISYLSTSSALICRYSYIKVSCYIARKELFVFTLLLERVPEPFLLSIQGWAIHIPNPKYFFCCLCLQVL